MIVFRYCAEGGKPACYSLTARGGLRLLVPAMLWPGPAADSLAYRPGLALIPPAGLRVTTAVLQP
jgi:hypothetical protein